MSIIKKDPKINQLAEYDNHHRVIFLNNPKTQLRGYIAIHRKNKNIPSFGATRLWEYDNSLDGLRDALRLSRLMSYKAALAGLPCGGAKGVILLPKQLKSREELLLSYAKAVNDLGGDFITGTDVGLSQDDLKLMKKESDFFVGFNDNATDCTALGIYYGMGESLKLLTGKSDLGGKTFAIQGLGKIGHALLSLIYLRAKKIYVTDMAKSVMKKIKKEFPRVSVVGSSEIHKQKVDFFSPCALGGTINAKTVNELNCRIIAGGANNQLENDKIGDSLFKLKILYAPDYVINAGGLIAVFDEYEHYKKNDKRIRGKVLAIKQRLASIFKRSKKENRSPHRIANKMAEKVFNGYQA